jgi:23S rRNA pseudouridine955/2504/2580 synthase
MTIELKTGVNDSGRRLDRILRKSLPDYSLSLIHRLLRQGKVTVNNKPAKPDDRIQTLSVIQLNVDSPVNHKKIKVNDATSSSNKPDINYRSQSVNKNEMSVNYRSEMVNEKEKPVNYRSQRVNRNDEKQARTSVLLPEIIWRGSGIIVFNKPTGLASHGKDSLDTLAKDWLADKIPPSLSFKPGPLHRLDRPTSGAIAFSECLEGARWFSRL